MEMLERDFWWEGMYRDVRRWCWLCQVCRGERGKAGTTAWARAELYSHPFRVLQFDTISRKTKEGQEGRSAKHVLTCVCVFRRWCWLIPLDKRDASTSAAGLGDAAYGVVPVRVAVG